MSNLLQAAFSDLESELAKTRVMLERIPSDHLDWQPHEKSWDLFKLARHIANIPTWVGMTLNSDGLDFSVPFPPRPVATTPAELLAEYDANCKQALADIQAATDAEFGKTWTLSKGDHVIFAQPKKDVIREWAISHMVHHRAQLSIYYRLVGVSVPPLYGPSADES
ncbi:DinB family protein [bacterium]|nr:DinB family protein [bacterium]